MIPLHDDNPTRRTAWVTIGIMVTCGAVYFGVQPVGRQFVGRTTSGSASCANLRFNLDHAAIPDELSHGSAFTVAERRGLLTVAQCYETARTSLPEHKNIWLAVVVSMFLHGGLVHLGGNMLFLWVFGNNIEDRLGRVRYLLFYLVAGLVATASYVAVDPSSPVPMIGASGAIAGVMGAYLVWFPRVRIRTLVIIVVIPLLFDLSAFWLLAFWLVSQFFISPSSGVAWVAHVGGFAFGAIVALLLAAGPRPSRRPTAPTWG